MILIIFDAAGVVYQVIKSVMVYLTVLTDGMNTTAVSACIITAKTHQIHIRSDYIYGNMALFGCSYSGSDACSDKATFRYSSQLQTWSKTWFSTRFSTRFSTSSRGLATRFRLFCRKPGRQHAASISTCRD